ncbi:BPL-N domain-containing protein [Streptomyces sp. NPDC088124]|uniref:BPL-N domain-containing protein n=1 Tax=Streptomyces sp. NPDC088124 TaxID=3154654 RepID=UPI003425003E
MPERVNGQPPGGAGERLHLFFESTCDRIPSATAVECGREELTYAQLDARANRLARGYTGRPELTADRFIEHPLAPAGSRLYRTGDLGRTAPGGAIEFLGRADSEVKIRGYRVDLGEIDSVLLEDPGVAEAVTTRAPAPDGGAGNGDSELAAYVTRAPDRTEDGDDDLAARLYERVRGRLPAYMVPAYLDILDAIPAMPSGKADLGRLPAPSRRLLGAGPVVAAHGTTETQVRDVWAEALGIEPGAQPGGGGLDEAYRHLERHGEAIRGYVRDGGRYLGFCMGGYLAGSGPGFALLPGDTDQYITSPDATVHDERDTIVGVAWRGGPRSLYFQDGPYFTLGDAPDADVLATYPNGTVAALTARFGAGRVGVVGPHPEATDDWFTDVDLPVRHTRDMGVDLVNAVLA